jgi:hypothetical protein
MSLVEWLAITIALLFVLYFTVAFVRRPSFKGFRTWMKNVIDALFGIG